VSTLWQLAETLDLFDEFDHVRPQLVGDSFRIYVGDRDSSFNRVQKTGRPWKACAE
jgi:hypothetical protein